MPEISVAVDGEDVLLTVRGQTFRVSKAEWSRVISEPARLSQEPEPDTA